MVWKSKKDGLVVRLDVQRVEFLTNILRIIAEMNMVKMPFRERHGISVVSKHCWDIRTLSIPASIYN